MSDDDRDDGTGDDDDQPISRRELATLTGRLDDLQSAQDELRSASTPAERQEARGDRDDAEDAFERAARAAGMDRADIVKAVRAAKDEQAYGSFKKMMDRYLGELPSDDKPDPKPRKRSQAGTSKGQPAQDGPPADTGPTHEHWSERRVSDIVR